MWQPLLKWPITPATFWLARSYAMFLASCSLASSSPCHHLDRLAQHSALGVPLFHGEVDAVQDVGPHLRLAARDRSADADPDRVLLLAARPSRRERERTPLHRER